MADRWANIQDLNVQGRKALAVTPSDSVDLTDIPKALYVGVSGDIVGLAVDDATQLTYKSVAVGVFDAVRFRRIFATGTTATNILAIY